MIREKSELANMSDPHKQQETLQERASVVAARRVTRTLVEIVARVQRPATHQGTRDCHCCPRTSGDPGHATGEDSCRMQKGTREL